jgi:hypothetical protein
MNALHEAIEEIGLLEFSRRVGVGNYQVVQHWKRRGVVPRAKYWTSIIEATRSCKNPVTAAHLLAITEGQEAAA